jgi:hypothetical protein
MNKKFKIGFEVVVLDDVGDLGGKEGVGGGVCDVVGASMKELNRAAVGGADGIALHMNQMQCDAHIMMHAAMELNGALVCGRW